MRVGGLFWFGLLLGFVSVVLAVNALRAMGRNGSFAPRGVAMAALMLGALADLIVLVSALASHARIATVFWNVGAPTKLTEETQRSEKKFEPLGLKSEQGFGAMLPVRSPSCVPASLLAAVWIQRALIVREGLDLHALVLDLAPRVVALEGDRAVVEEAAGHVPRRLAVGRLGPVGGGLAVDLQDRRACPRR